ncbi:MAG TPA: cupredoxin domain-containing protein [Acidimicrobiia bacterium]|nr:cupredoxin domain-containing protein [Acidimicrobiia bacterium]
MSRYRRTRVLSLAAAVCLLLAACSPDPGGSADEGGGPSLPAAPEQGAGTGAAATAGPLAGADSAGVDIAQGEWALVSSALEAPPGAITFRFRNLGTVPHALRIRTAGSGGDRLEWRAEAIGPGQSGVLVADLPPGTYEIDCPIEDGHGEHDQLGMEILFTVREGAPELAPLAREGATVSASPEAADSAVAIAAFAFEPAELGVPAGTTVAWTNNDPTPHTVTGDTFDTGALEPGTTGSVTFEAAGTFEYFCAIHPTMRGRVVVEP